MTTHDPSGCCPGHNLELIVFAVSGTNYQFDGSPMSAIGSTGNPVLYPHTNGYNEMIIAYAVDGVQVLTAGSPYSFIGTSGNNGAEYLVLPGPAGPSASFGNSQGEWAEVVDIIQPIPGISFSFSPQSVPLAASGTSSSTVTVAVANFVPIGTYTVYISSTAPSILHLIPITVNVANFLISANPPTVITNIGSTGASTIKVTPLGTFSAAVNLSLNNAACTVSPTSVTAGGNSTVSCMSPNATMFVVTVTGTSGSESHSTPVTYIIQDFNISATPTNALINTGSSSLSTITLRSINWFQGTIGLSYVSVPTGLSCSPFSPASINLPQSVVTATATFYCNSSSLGTYSIVVRGTSGSITHNATATFSFSDLTISGSPSTVNMLPSGSGTSTINLASNGFSGTVSLYSCSTCQSVYAMPTLDGWASGYCHSTGSTQCSATLSTHSSGDLIIVFVSSPTTLSNGFTLSDAAGLSFNSRIFVQASYGNPFQDISVKEFWAISSSPLTSDTITMTTQDPPFCCPGHNLELIAFGVSGSNYQFDGPPVASIQPSGNPGVTVPTNGPNRMIIGYAVDGSQSLTAGQGFVFIGTSGNNGAEYLVAPTGALVSFGNAQGEWAEVADAIQPASGFSISFVPSNIPLSNGGTAGSTATITAASFVPMGTYTVTVVGATSIGSRSASIVVNVGNFGIATSPTTVVANVGYPGMSTITVTPVGGFTGTVGLSVNNPACTLSPSSVTGSGTSTLSCSSPNPTSFTVTVIGTSGAESHTATVVYAFQDFTVSGPSKVSVTEGYYSRIPITWTALSSNLAPMNITFSGSVPQPYQPSGSIRTGPLGISFSPASLVLGPGQSANVLMILSDAGAPAGVTYYPIQVTGTNGPATHTVVMNATVTGYSISSEGGYQCTATNYILCLSAQQNAVPGVPVDLFASGITGTVTYTTSISACVSGCNGGTPPTVYWLDTGTSSSNITITSTSCNLRNIYSTSNTASFCGNKELIIHAYSGIGNYNITVGATCVSGFCVNYGFGPKTYTFYILFNVFTSGGGGGGSVAAGTLITLADGSQVPVQNLHIGEQLLSYDLTSGQYVVTNITRLATVETYNQMVISTGNGKPLIVDQNPAQKLYVRLQDGKVTLMSVTDLRVGYDLFYATSQTWVPIISIHYENSGTHLMYDIYTTSPGNYVANGYLDPLKT